MNFKIVYIFLICVAYNCYGQNKLETIKGSCKFVSVETVSEELVLLKAVKANTNDSLNILIEKDSFSADSLIISRKNENIRYLIEVKQINDFDLKRMFSVRKTEFKIYVEDKQVISSENIYYSLISFDRK